MLYYPCKHIFVPLDNLSLLKGLHVPVKYVFEILKRVWVWCDRISAIAFVLMGTYIYYISSCRKKYYRWNEHLSLKEEIIVICHSHALWMAFCELLWNIRPQSPLNHLFSCLSPILSIKQKAELSLITYRKI
jgi:hypothetical protein